jgi:putative ABC transport system substrate-binding protein
MFYRTPLAASEQVTTGNAYRLRGLQTREQRTKTRCFELRLKSAKSERGLVTLMKRREFIALVGGASAWPLAAVAQQPAGMKRIAIVHPDEKVGNMTLSGGRTWRALFERLGDHGYVEGDNLLVDRYSGQGRTDNYGELARDVVGTNPDLIFSSTLRLSLNFKTATSTIPIVAVTNDPVAGGLVASIARPEANITGVSVDAGEEIWGKRLGLLVRLRRNRPTLASSALN